MKDAGYLLFVSDYMISMPRAYGLCFLCDNMIFKSGQGLPYLTYVKVSKYCSGLHDIF